jgi:anti-sigma B factor antagonist
MVVSSQILNIRDDGAQVTLSLYGKLDITTVAEVNTATNELIQSVPTRWPTVVVDLMGLDLIDSSGVSALVSLYKRARQNGGHALITGARDQPLAVFRLLRLDHVFGV